MSSDIEITITNPDGQTVKPVMVGLPQFDEYLDKPRRFQVAIEKSSGLDPQGTAKVTRRGKTILLGHVKKLDESKPDKDTLLLQSAEALLDERIGQFYRYPAGTRLDAILGSSAGGDVVGLLCMANGLIPRGGWELHAGSVYKITGAGTSSRMGTLTQLYQGVTLLTKVTAIPSASGQWYQSSTDLYVWATDDRSPRYHQMIAPNFKDTLLRLGTISLASTTFSVCYEVGEVKLWPTIKALILAGGLEYSIRYEKDGYAYLDAASTVGQGSSSAPVATYIDGDNAEISLDEMDGDGHIQALIGQGAGAGITQQCAAAFDFVTAGTWREAIYQAGGMFGAMLQTATEKVFSDYSDPKIYKVDAPEQDWAQGCGNYVGIIRPGSQPVFKRIKHIAMKGGRMELEVGQRLRTLQEILKGKEEVQNVLASFYGAHTKNAWSWSLPETNIDSYEAITHSFLLQSTDKSGGGEDDSLGDGEIDPNFPYHVILSLSVGWFKASTYSATQQNDLHSNVGSHGGYGGGTNAKPMTAHSVNSFTGVAASYQVDAMTTVVSNGSHSHSVSNTADSRTTGSGGSPAHTHYYTDYSGYSTGSAGSHSHSGYYYPVSHASHVHTIPTHSTNAAGSQDHEWGTGGGSGGYANTRAGSNEHPERQAILEGLIKKYGTGNSIHYLTLTIKVNGVQVPGSPFSGAGGTGLYIGDSIDYIDISDLVTVGAYNTIELSISEFGGFNMVRCSLSGNVNVSAIISAF